MCAGLFRRKQPVTGAESREQMLPLALDDASMPGAATRLRAARVDATSIKGVNQFFLGWQRRTDGGEVCIGDTASIIPPFTGNGMSMAFQSALLAVEPLVDWAEKTASWRDTAWRIREEQRSRFATRLRWSWVLHGLLLTQTSRRLCCWVLRKNLVSFETIYRKVR